MSETAATAMAPSNAVGKQAKANPDNTDTSKGCSRTAPLRRMYSETVNDKLSEVLFAVDVSAYQDLRLLASQMNVAVPPNYSERKLRANLEKAARKLPKQELYKLHGWLSEYTLSELRKA